MRELGPGLSLNTVGRFVRPTYLLKLYYDDNSSPLCLCSNANVSWSNQMWTHLGFKVSGVGWEVKQRAKPSLEFQNIDNVIASLLFNSTVADKQVDIYLLYLYDKQVFYTDKNHPSGSTEISVSTPIPPDIIVPGVLWAGASRTTDQTSATDMWNWNFSAIKGNAFTINPTGSDSVPAIDSGTEIFALRGGSVGAMYTATDAVQIFHGVVDEFELDEKSCTISLAQESTKTQFTPRRYVIKQNGFNWLPQAGTQIYWAGEVYTCERMDY